MNLRDLKYLVAVAEHQHFGKAAKACFVSQPALSMQLAKLEGSLGVQLFERTNKSVMITSVGQDITDRAKIILQEAHEITEVARAYQDPFAGELRLGAFPTLAPYFLPKMVPHITEEYPNLTLLLIEEKTDVLLSQLQDGKLDAALIALPIEQDSFEYEELFEDEFLLAVSQSHTFSKRTSVARDDLQGQSLLLLEDGHCLRDQALDVCTLIGVSEKQDFRATSLETLRQMVFANVGVTLIPKIAQNVNDGLVYISFKENPPSRKIALVWRKTTARAELFHEISQQIRDMNKSLVHK